MKPQFGASLTDDARSVIYDRNMFISQATAYSANSSAAGQPDWAIFHQLGYFFEAHWRNSQKMAAPWASYLLHFHPNKLFKNVFVFWHYLAWHLFWLLFKKLGNFFQIIWSPCSVAKKISFMTIVPDWCRPWTCTCSRLGWSDTFLRHRELFLCPGTNFIKFFSAVV